MRHDKDKLFKENDLLKKDANALKAEASESAQKTFSNFEKMMNCSNNLDFVLGSQRLYFEKSGLRYEKKENEKPSKSSQDKVLICFFYFKKGHSFEKCFSQRKAKKPKVKNPKKITNP